MNIAFAGPFRGGKSTSAEYLEDVYQLDILSFAFHLREALVAIGIPYEVVYGKKDDKLRTLMQAVGQAMRDFDEDFWSNKMAADLDLEFYDDGVVIDDMRYWNEAEMLRDRGFKLVHVTIPGIEDDGDPRRQHDSERDLDDWDDWDAKIVCEKGDIEGLYTMIDSLIDRWAKEE